MEAGKTSWAKQGFEHLKAEEDRVASMYGPSRVWIPAGNSQEWVFLDDNPFSFHEHNPKIDGSWRNWITCLQGVQDETPCCEILGQKSRYFTGYFTVVDLSKWTDKKGNSHQYEIKLVGAKMKTLKKLARKKEQRGSLVGCIFKVTREDDKSPNVGDDFEYVRDADLSRLFEVANFKGTKFPELFSKASEDPSAMNALKRNFNVSFDDNQQLVKKLPIFNYYSLFEPKAAKDLRTFLKASKIESGDDFEGGAAGGSKSGSQPSGADEDIPF